MIASINLNRHEFLRMLRRHAALPVATFFAQPSLLAQPNKKPSSIITSRAAAGGGGAAAWYTDVAPQSDFAYRTNNNFTGRKYFPQPMCGGVALFDFDNDGHLDIFLTNGAKLPELQKTDASFHNALLRNNGDGKFTDVTASAGLAGTDLGYSFGVAAADYNNDGFADLFVANAGHNVLYRNNGDGTFADVTVKSGLNSKPSDLLSVGAAWLDYDRDGLLDLVVSNYTNWTPSTDQRCTRGGTLDVYCNPSTYKKRCAAALSPHRR
ncbi:MAG: VCBS repeat-containing protein [Pyrinomonadaceae bacterium]